MGTRKEPNDRWVPRNEAASFLGVSVRELQRKAARYPLQLRQQRPSRNEPSVFQLSDLIAFKERLAAKLNPQTVETQLRGGSAPEGKAVVGLEVLDPAAVARIGGTEIVQAQAAAYQAQADAFRALAEHLATLSARYAQPPPPPDPEWMTLAQAAEYSGLPVSFLRSKCVDGSMGRNVSTGAGPRRRYRISRMELAWFSGADPGAGE